MNTQTPPVVGETGERIKADSSANVKRYAYFMATNSHPDTLPSRMREHVSYYGCAYLCVGVIALTIFLLAALTDSPIFEAASCMVVPLMVIVSMATSPKNGGN